MKTKLFIALCLLILASCQKPIVYKSKYEYTFLKDDFRIDTVHINSESFVYYTKYSEIICNDTLTKDSTGVFMVIDSEEVQLNDSTYSTHTGFIKSYPNNTIKGMIIYKVKQQIK